MRKSGQNGSKRGLFLKKAFWGTFICLMAVRAVCQDFSNKGKDFWLVYPDHVDGNASVMGLYITSDVNASGTIRVGSNTIPFTVTANTTARKFIGPNAGGDAPNTNIVHRSAEGILTNSGIRITADQPVVVYAHIINAARSGATLAIPVNVLGKDYIVPSYRSAGASGVNSGYGQVTVVAPEANTTIEVIPVAISRNGARRPGDTVRITLPDAGDVYQLQFQKDADISGTRVRSIASATGGCKPIAVFSSSTWSAFDCTSASGGDNLFQQLFPISAWGKSFLVAPFITKPYDIIRVFVNPDNPPTAVTKTEDGITTPLTGLNNGYYEFQTFQKPVKIDADKPISVVQYMTSLSCDTRNPANCFTNQSCPFPSDPEMVILNPIEQTINDITVFSAHRAVVPANQSNVDKCFLNIIIRSSVAASFRINGQPPTGTFRPIPGTDYVYLQEDVSALSISNPVQTLKADSSFIAIAYGYGSVESYGYNAGTAVKDLSQRIEVNNIYGTAPFPSTCINTPFNLSIVLPYKPGKMVWKCPILNLDTTIINPVQDGATFVLNGLDVQRYRLPNTFRRTVSGSVPVQLTTETPTSDGCGISTRLIEYDIQVFSQPKAKLAFTTTGCFRDEVRFADSSFDTGGRPIIRHIWDLGDGIPPTPSTSPMPGTAKTYTSKGVKTVSLSVITDVGCVSETDTRTIALSEKPSADFSISAPSCQGLPVVISDRSQTFGDAISQWMWDEGDGTVDTLTTGADRTVSFPSPTTVNLSLALRTATGCLSATKVKPLIVNPNPKADFEIPEVCIRDNEAIFTDRSTIPDGSQASFAFQWDMETFGIRTERNPRITGFALRSYEVRLRVTSKDGCVDSVRKTFTVNGAIPDPKLSISNLNALCSNRQIELTNNSTADFGSVTKIDLIWDPADPLSRLTDDTPAVGKKYLIGYPDFGSPPSKNFNVVLVAHTGGSCRATLTVPIVVNGSPQLVFDPMSRVCEEATPFTITSARETSGISGVGNFIGPGIVSGPLFNPSQADSGTHLIKYIFRTTAGCTDTADQTIRVDPTPTANAGPDRMVLEDSSILIGATASPFANRFSWSPPLGLNSPDTLTPIATPKDDTWYRLAVFSPYGCSSTDEVFVKVLKMPKPPNTFTPNGDGFNDRWVIEYLEFYKGAIVEVYNTQGQLVYRSVDYLTPWDGSYRGRPLPAGTYYYVLDPKNERKRISGYVTILR